MGDLMTSMTRGGQEWVPVYIVDLNQENCIGCGRCFKVCSRDVFELVEREAMDDLDDDDDDSFSDDNSMVMAIKNGGDCIGCQACAKVCPKDCQTHAPQPKAA